MCCTATHSPVQTHNRPLTTTMLNVSFLLPTDAGLIKPLKHLIPAGLGIPYFHSVVSMPLNILGRVHHVFYVERIMKWKTLDKVAEESGLTKESLRALKKKGILRERIHWIKAPNGRIMLDVAAFEQWLCSEATRV